MRAKLNVGPDGEIAVPRQEAEALGLVGGGEVEYLTARGAAALLVPVHAGAAPRAWFAGSLEALAVPEVIQFVFSSLKTGVLLLAFGERAARGNEPERLRRRSIHFREGQVVFASSSDPDDRLGPVLVDAGLVKLSDVERCSHMVRSGRPLGQVLVDEGVLNAGQLYDAITMQVKRIFLDCFVEEEGEFAFIEGITDEQNQVKLPERTRELILQGMKRVAEAELRAAEAEAAAAVAAAPAPAPVDVEQPAATPPPTATPVPAGKKVPGAAGPFETYRRIFRHVHAALKTAEPDAAARLNSWFDRLPEKRRAIFEGVRFDEHGGLDVAAVLMNVNAGGAYQGAAARARSLEALEELLAFALFEAKNRLPKPEAEKLLREVGRMQVGKA